MQRFSQRFIVSFYLLALITFSCARKAPVTQPAPPSKTVTAPTVTLAPKTVTEFDAVTLLRTKLDRIFADPVYANAFWGVAIQSLDKGEILYQQNAGKLLMPASNMKLITAVASLKRLGPGFTYETTLKRDGEIENGVLKGNLIVIGTGDPAISSRFKDTNEDTDNFKIFNDWAAMLKQAGIEAISGDVIAVDDAFDDERLGYGWSWDDLPYYYATETGALQFAENSITVTMIARRRGESLIIRKEPETSYIKVVTDVDVQTGNAVQIDWDYDPETQTVYASGTLPVHGQDYGSFSVSNPGAYFAHTLKETLRRNEIIVRGEAYRARDRKFVPDDDAREIFVHRSPPLSEIISVLLKVSQNLYGETLLKTLGKGTFEAGTQEMEKVLAEMNIPPHNSVIKDGSGLSRYNYVTPTALLQLLNHMYRDPQFYVFYNALPSAGSEGTLKARLKGTSAENNVRAKTGSISNVQSISGYLRTKDQEMIGFVLIANNFDVSDETAKATQDSVIQLLSNFSRAQ